MLMRDYNNYAHEETLIFLLILYYTISIILHCTALHCTALYYMHGYTIPYYMHGYTIPYYMHGYTIPYYTILYHTICMERL